MPSTLTSLSFSTSRTWANAVAFTTPGLARTASTVSCGISWVVLNGPVPPSATTNASAPNIETTRWFSRLRCSNTPLRSRARPKAIAVASTAMTKRRLRWRRSWRPTRHIAYTAYTVCDPSTAQRAHPTVAVAMATVTMERTRRGAKRSRFRTLLGTSAVFLMTAGPAAL